VVLAENDKAKKGSSKGYKEKEKKKDLSKIKCFIYRYSGHYVSQCPNWKKEDKKKKGKSQTKTSTNIENISSRLDDEFAVIACLSSSTATGVWYIDSGASCHMTRVRE